MVSASPNEPQLLIQRLSDRATLPTRGSAGAAGYDLSAACDTKVPARGKALVPTDLSLTVPHGTYGRVAPRSGLAHKHFIDVGAGVIDSDYTGPLGVILFNHSENEFVIHQGDRIAQLILEQCVVARVVEVESLSATQRGAGGFGSTGGVQTMQQKAVAALDTVKQTVIGNSADQSALPTQQQQPTPQ